MKRFEAHLERTAPDLLATYHQVQSPSPVKTYDGLQRRIEQHTQSVQEELSAQQQDEGRKSIRNRQPPQPGMKPPGYTDAFAQELSESAESMMDKIDANLNLKLLLTQLKLHRELLKLEGKKE